MKRLRQSATCAAMAMCLAAPAVASDLNYSYIEGAYIDTELDDIDVDGDGFAVNGSLEVTDTVFVVGSLASQEFDFGIDSDQWSIGVGGHMPVSDKVDLVGSLSFVSVEVDTTFGDADDDGFGLNLGLRGKLNDKVELEGGVAHVDLDDSGDDTSFVLSGRYYFSPDLAAGLSLQTGDDATTWAIGVRMEF